MISISSITFSLRPQYFSLQHSSIQFSSIIQYSRSFLRRTQTESWTGQGPCLLECEDAHLVSDVELAGAVEVEDGVEGSGVAVEEVLVVSEGVVVAQPHDLLVGPGAGEHAQSGGGHRVQDAPHDLVPHLQQ